MNSIDMRVGATVGMGNIAVENPAPRATSERKRTAGIEVENWPARAARGEGPEGNYFYVLIEGKSFVRRISRVDIPVLP